MHQSTELKLAISLARKAGDLTVSLLDAVRVEKSKADERDIVTNADTQTE